MLFQTIKEWPRDIYDIGAVIVAVKDEVDKVKAPAQQTPKTVVLMECLAELQVVS